MSEPHLDTRPEIATLINNHVLGSQNQTPAY
jgi:hypothetical protein